MILCWCCEVRDGYRLGQCGCAADYHWECGLCDEHCPCDPVPHVVRGGTSADPIDPSLGGDVEG